MKEKAVKSLTIEQTVEKTTTEDITMAEGESEKGEKVNDQTPWPAIEGPPWKLRKKELPMDLTIQSWWTLVQMRQWCRQSSTKRSVTQDVSCR